MRTRDGEDGENKFMCLGTFRFFRFCVCSMAVYLASLLTEVNGSRGFTLCGPFEIKMLLLHTATILHGRGKRNRL